MMRKILFFVLLSCFAFGQNKKETERKKAILDSLLFKVLPSINQKDTKSQMEIYDLAEKYISDKLQNYTSYIYTGKSKIYNNLGETEQALYYANLSYKYAKAFGDSIGSARALQQTGVIYGMRNDLKKSEQFIKKSTAIVENNIYNPKIDSTKNKNLLLQLKSNLSLNYLLQKRHKESTQAAFQTLNLAKKLNNKKVEILQYGYIAGNYRALEENKKALEYYLLENQLAIETGEKSKEAYSYIHIAQTLRDLKQYKYVENYIQKAENIFNELKLIDGITKVKHAYFTYYRLTENLDKSLQYVPELILLYTENKGDVSHLFVELGEIYTKLKDYNKAEEYFAKAEKIIDEKQLSKLLLNRKRAFLEEEKGNFAKALELKGKELEIRKDEIDSSFTNNLANYEVQYQTSKKETKIKSQQIELKKEKTNTNIAIFGIGFILLLSGCGFLFFRNRQKQKELQNQNTLLSLQQNLNAMELQSLNKQLDPHEIKNLLASISPEIQEKAPESYRKMLKLFNITKASLNNHSLTESIEIQIQQIEDFLSLEKMMLSENFEYSVENKIENKELQIPRLMLKNLVENSIKHGIKGNGGLVNVSILEKNNFITIIVDDSGKGRKHAISLDSGIGTSTYQNLFATLNQKNKENATFEIIDKEQGTKVEVKIPIDYKYN